MRKLRVHTAAALLLCAALLFSGCGTGSGGGAAGSAPMAEAQVYDVTSGDSGGYVSAGAIPLFAEPRKVVTRAEFYISTEDFEGAMRSLDHKIAVSGSYIQQTESVAANEYRGAWASMTIRVPAEGYGSFKEFLTGLAELTSAREYGEDVTVQYYDTEARLGVLRAQEERIREFISKAGSIDEIFKIERELVRISTEIEQLTTVKNRLDNLTSYATVYVEITDGREIEIKAASFGARVNDALKGSVENLVAAGQAVLLVLIWCWPLVLIGAAAAALWRKFRKNRKSNLKENV